MQPISPSSISRPGGSSVGRAGVTRRGGSSGASNRLFMSRPSSADGGGRSVARIPVFDNASQRRGNRDPQSNFRAPSDALSSSASRRSFGDPRGIGRSGGPSALGFGDNGHGGAGSGRTGRDGSRFISDRYFSAYDRLDQSPSRISWLLANNYPSSAFGVGLGLYRSGHGGFGDGHHGRSHLLFGGHGFDDHGLGHHSSVGLDIGFGYRSYYHPYHYYGSFYRPYYYHGYYRPYSYRYYAPYSDYGYDGLGYSSYAPGYNVYENNNYYYSDNDDDYDDGGGSARGGEYVPRDSSSYVPDGGSGARRQAPVAVGGAYRELGEQNYYQGRYEDARRNFVRAMLDAPNDAELMVLYGFAHFAEGDYRLASSSLERALRQDPSLIDSPLDLSRLYSDPARLTEQIRRLDDYLSRVSRDDGARLVAGYVRYASGKPAEAEPYFAAVISGRPDATLALLLRDAAIRAQRLLDSAPRQKQPPSQPSGSAPGSIELQDVDPPSSASHAAARPIEMEPMVLIDD